MDLLKEIQRIWLRSAWWSTKGYLTVIFKCIQEIQLPFSFSLCCSPRQVLSLNNRLKENWRKKKSHKDMDVKWKADTIGRTAGSLLESFIFTSDIQFKCKTDSLVPCTARPGWFQCLSSQGMDQHVRGYHSVSKSVAKYSLNQTKAPVWPQWPPWPLCKWHFCGSGEGISCLDIYFFVWLKRSQAPKGPWQVLCEES